MAQANLTRDPPDQTNNSISKNFGVGSRQYQNQSNNNSRMGQGR